MHTPHDERRTERRTTDVSAGWRAEYAAQEVATAVLPDGGEERPGVGVGDRVKDLDSEADDELLVVDTHATEAAAFAIDGLDATVADLNPGYPPEDRVVEAVYLEEVHGTVEAWRTAADLRDAVAVGAINSYSFPASRLGAIDGESGGQLEAFL